MTSIDRLASSTVDLFAIVKQIADTSARFRSLAESWADIDTTPAAHSRRAGGLADWSVT